MVRHRWSSLLGAAVVCAAGTSVPSSFAAEDEKGFVILMPNEIKYEKNPAGSGPDLAVVAGDPTKEGFYIIRARFAPGVMSMPHSHPGDRHVTVISGTWWAGKGATFDPNSTTPLGPGSYMLHPAGEVHFDGAKDVEAIVEIKGMGPAPSIPAAR
jgi:quercetin dioxygenase-like cupin family protein